MALSDFAPSTSKKLESSGVGGIDLSRPIINNPDGSISTERTITIEADGKHYLIPTIVGGKTLTADAAVAAWRSGTNKPVGIFNSAAEAESSAVTRSTRIGELRGGGGNRLSKFAPSVKAPSTRLERFAPSTGMLGVPEPLSFDESKAMLTWTPPERETIIRAPTAADAQAVVPSSLQPSEQGVRALLSQISPEEMASSKEAFTPVPQTREDLGLFQGKAAEVGKKIGAPLAGRMIEDLANPMTIPETALLSAGFGMAARGLRAAGILKPAAKLVGESVASVVKESYAPTSTTEMWKLTLDYVDDKMSTLITPEMQTYLSKIGVNVRQVREYAADLVYGNKRSLSKLPTPVRKLIGDITRGGPETVLQNLGADYKALAVNAGLTPKEAATFTRKALNRLRGERLPGSLSEPASHKVFDLPPTKKVVDPLSGKTAEVPIIPIPAPQVEAAVARAVASIPEKVADGVTAPQLTVDTFKVIVDAAESLTHRDPNYKLKFETVD